MPLDTAQIRQEFPILRSGENIYLDSAATAQKPEAVLDAMNRYYQEENANVHRGMHGLAEKATVAYEDARKAIAMYIGAKPHEVVFTKNCTEAINLVAHSWGKANLSKGDTVVLSILEHHSNIIPWLQLKERIGIDVQWVDIDEHGMLKMDDLDRLLSSKTVKLVSITGLSNVLGTGPDVKHAITKAHDAGAKILIDAAQLIVHQEIDVCDLNCDFLTFSGHKLYGPTGIGVLYTKRELLESMPPFLGGGMMIGEVTKAHFTTADIPAKFEAGTPPIAQAVGVHAAIRWVQQFDPKDRKAHEDALIQTAIAELKKIDGLHILGSPTVGCISFTVDGVHPHDLTDAIGKHGVCLRAGHHCTQPLHDRLGISASTRLSVALYNTEEDIVRAVDALRSACTLLAR